MRKTMLLTHTKAMTTAMMMRMKATPSHDDDDDEACHGKEGAPAPPDIPNYGGCYGYKEAVSYKACVDKKALVVGRH